MMQGLEQAELQELQNDRSPREIRAAYEAALRERVNRAGAVPVGVGQTAAGGSSTLKWLVIFAIAGGVAYGIYELTKKKDRAPDSGVRRSGGRGQVWYGTTPSLDFQIGRAQGKVDARRKGYAELARRGRYRERLTDVYWLAGA